MKLENGLVRHQQPTTQTSNCSPNMKDFNMRFVELCGNEPALYDPRYFKDHELAVGRISGALPQKGFTCGPEEVKPTFDQLRVQYEMELENRIKGRYSELKWFHEMDAYMRPFVCQLPASSVGVDSGPLCSSSATLVKETKPKPSCSNSDPSGAVTPTEDIKLDNQSEEEDNTPCDVCREVSPEDDNEMIFCSLCDVCVHQACYGVKVVPEGDWYCQPCQLKKKPACALCPKEGGAMKCTRDGFQWAHVSCTWWIGEARFEDPETVAAVDISRIPERRWKLVCSLCRNKYGACIQCIESGCTVAFHVTCAFDRGLKMNMYDDPEKDVIWVSYCRKHSLAINTPKSKKNRKQKKKTRKYRKEVEKNHTAPLKLPSRYFSMAPQTSTSEAVTSDGSINELSEDDNTSYKSDSSIHSYEMDQSSLTSESLSNDNPFSNTGTSEIQISAVTGAINEDKTDDTTLWNTQTNAMEPTFEERPNVTNQGTNRDGACICRKPSFTEEPPSKRVRFMEPSSEPSPSMQNISSVGSLPVIETHNTRISFDNSETTMPSFSVEISSKTQSKPRESCHMHSQAMERDRMPSFLREQPTSLQTKHCSPFKNQPLASPQDLCSQTSRDQPSTSSFIQKETIEKSTANGHSENVDYEQLTKYVTLRLKSLAPHEAKRLERKILLLCTKRP